MKKRLLAFVLVVALFGGFAQSFASATPASADELCAPGFTPKSKTFYFPVYNNKNKLKSIALAGVGYCHDNPDVYVPATWLDVDDQANWVIDPNEVSITQNNYGDYEIIYYNYRWDKYESGVYHGAACLVAKVVVYADGSAYGIVHSFDLHCSQET